MRWKETAHLEIINSKANNRMMMISVSTSGSHITSTLQPLAQNPLNYEEFFHAHLLVFQVLGILG